MARRKLMLFASEVPVISALNPFRPIEDVFTAAWRRADATRVKALQERVHVEQVTPAEKARQLVRDLKVETAVDALLQEASAAQAVSQVAEAAAKIEKALPVSTSAEAKAEVVQFVQSEMHKSFGIKHESTAILHYEQERDVVVAQRNLAFFKKRVAAVGAFDLFVGGKIDGRADGKIVEIKNRLHRFPSAVPKYDIAQLQTYLYILDATEAELVEYLRRGEAATRTTTISWDPHMWNQQIAPFLIQFSRALVHFMGDEEDQIRYLTGEAQQQKEIIRAHWTKSMIS